MAGKKYAGLHPDFFNNKRIQQLSDRQWRIYLASIFCLEAQRSKVTGIYKVSTTRIMEGIPVSDIQDEMGRSDMEISLLTGRKPHEFTEEDQSKKIGLMQRDFPDLFAYDPEHDMLFNKVKMEYSGVLYLSSAVALIEGIHADFNNFFLQTDELWWGELMHRNHRLIHDAWKKSQHKFPLDEKEIHPVREMFLRLQDLEMKFVATLPKPPTKIIPVKILSDSEIHETFMKVGASQLSPVSTGANFEI